MQDQRWQDKAEEVQSYANSHITKKFFISPKTVYGPSRSGCSPLLSSDGSTLIKDQVGLRERWPEHFSSPPNRSSTVDAAALNQLPSSQPVRSSTCLPPLTKLRELSSRKTQAGHQERMLSLLSCIQQKVPTSLRPSMMSCRASGKRRRCLMNSAMPW